jgi:FkbM family methyltransferase
MSFIQKISYFIINNLKKAGIEEISSHFIYTPTCFNSTFIDLGANQGDFYQAFQSKFNATGYAVEASPSLFKDLPKNPKVNPFNYAISDKSEQIDFYISNNCEANSINKTISQQWGLKEKVSIKGITIDEFINQAQICTPIGLLKIDIEGSEIEVLTSATEVILGEIEQIAVEFHDFIIKDEIYLSKMNKILTKLKNLNFDIVQISINDYREILCINKSQVELSLESKFRIKVIHPFLKSLKKLHTKLHQLKNND